MPRPGSIIPKVPIAKIMNKAGAKRVSEGAIRTLTEYLIDYASKLSERAVKIAKHSGRKTVNAADIKIAVK
jgi:histone H3/H4